MEGAEARPLRCVCARCHHARRSSCNLSKPPPTPTHPPAPLPPSPAEAVQDFRKMQRRFIIYEPPDLSDAEHAAAHPVREGLWWAEGVQQGGGLGGGARRSSCSSGGEAAGSQAGAPHKKLAWDTQLALIWRDFTGRVDGLLYGEASLAVAQDGGASCSLNVRSCCCSCCRCCCCCRWCCCCCRCGCCSPPDPRADAGRGAQRRDAGPRHGGLRPRPTPPRHAQDTTWTAGEVKRKSLERHVRVMDEVNGAMANTCSGCLYATDVSMPAYAEQNYPVDAPGASLHTCMAAPCLPWLRA